MWHPLVESLSKSLENEAVWAAQVQAHPDRERITAELVVLISRLGRHPEQQAWVARVLAACLKTASAGRSAKAIKPEAKPKTRGLTPPSGGGAGLRKR